MTQSTVTMIKNRKQPTKAERTQWFWHQVKNSPLATARMCPHCRLIQNQTPEQMQQPSLCPICWGPMKDVLKWMAFREDFLNNLSSDRCEKHGIDYVEEPDLIGRNGCPVCNQEPESAATDPGVATDIDNLGTQCRCWIVPEVCREEAIDRDIEARKESPGGTYASPKLPE